MTITILSKLKIPTGIIFTILPVLLIAQQNTVLQQNAGFPSPTVSPTIAPTASPDIIRNSAPNTTAPNTLPSSTSIPPVNNPPIITAQAAVVFDPYTGKIIYRYNETTPRPVASTQKLLTALIIAESGNLDKQVQIEKSDTIVSPIKLGLRAGEIYTRWELLSALLVKSANDVAMALARDNAGSIPEFSKKMNHRITELLGTSSHFENPNGLPIDTQYSTARDMAIVARAAYANPIIREIINYRTINFRFNNGKNIVIPNTNHLLRDYSFCNGMKTGYTEKAGHCLIASGTWNNKDVIAVILGEPARSKIWKDGKSLLAYGLGLHPQEVEAARISKAPSGKKHPGGSRKSHKRHKNKRHA